MTKNKTKKYKTKINNCFIKSAITSAAVILLLIMAACGKKETKEVKTFIDVLDDGSIAACFDKTAKGTAGGTGIMIEEGEYLAIDTEITEGKVRVRIISGGSDIDSPPSLKEDQPAAVDHVFEDTGTTEYMMIEPGDYFFSVQVEEKASGTITAYKKPVPSDAE